jgi:hypothetical protein
MNNSCKINYSHSCGSKCISVIFVLSSGKMIEKSVWRTSGHAFSIFIFTTISFEQRYSTPSIRLEITEMGMPLLSFQVQPCSYPVSYMARMFSMGVMGWMLWQGARIYPPPCPRILRLSKTSFRTSSGVPKGRVI